MQEIDKRPFKKEDSFRSGEVDTLNSAAAGVDFYLQTQNIFSRYVQNYVEWYSSKTYVSPQEKREKKMFARIALEDFYFAQKDDSAFKQLKKQWGEEAEPFESLLIHALPEIQKAQDLIISRSSTFSEKQRIVIAMKAAFAVPSLAEDQRRRLFMAAGYNGDETEFILKKIGTSVVLGSSLSTASEWIAGAAIGAGVINPIVEDISDPKTLALLALTYLTYNAGVAVNAEQNVKLIRNEKTKTCTSFLSTSAYYLLNKISSGKKQDVVVKVGSVISDVVREARLTPLLLTPFGPSAILGVNITGTIKQAVQAGVIALWLYTHKPQEESGQ